MSEIEAKSYRYLRMTIVILLLGVGVAVLYQTSRQHFHILGSISAYYYTPAQAIFVGSLIGVGACMVALKGTTEFEDIVLNLGGMFAAVVALVPTARGEDYETAVRACEQQEAGPLLTDQASRDCSSVSALAEATRANVDNSMITLLVLGFLSLVVTIAFALSDRRSNRGQISKKFLWGFAASFVVWALGWVALLLDREWFIDNAHYIAATGLFACVFAVTVANALRREGRQFPGGWWFRWVWHAVGASVSTLVRWPLSSYAWVAWSMIVGALTMTGLWLGHVVTLFWVELVVALLFIAFWVVQTIELLGEGSGRESGSGGSVSAAADASPAVSGAGA